MSKTERAARILDRTGLGVLLRRVRAWRGVLILNYHRLGDPQQSLLDHDLWSSSADGFAAQVRFLVRNFDLVGAEELGLELVRTRGRHAVLTFDDGYRDNYTVAYPVLREHGARATFFLTTGFIDGEASPWWDDIAWLVRTSPRQGVPADGWVDAPVTFDEPGRQQAVTRLRRVCAALPGDRVEEFLRWLAAAADTAPRSPEEIKGEWITWDMARELKGAGMTIGAHTVTHPVLASVPAARQHEEISRSVRRLEQELGETPPVFSYPVGWRSAFTEETKSLVRDTGIRLAFSNYGGYPSPSNWDPYDIRRTNLSVGDGESRFRATATLPQLFARW